LPEDNAKIREMTEDDLEAVSGIELDVFTDPWPRSVFLEDIASDYSHPFVVQWDNDIVAYAILWQGVDEGHLTNIAVAKNYHRKSIAQKLLSFILQFASEAGLMQVLLEVRPSNEAAIALYRKFGFINLAIRKNYYTHPREDCLMMIKYLSGETDIRIGE